MSLSGNANLIAEDDEAKRDQELLERVLLRFALADDTSKLEKTVENFLVPILDKANSPIASTKKKVGEVLSHISFRLKADRSASIPLVDLVQQYVHQTSSTLLRALSLIFIELAFSRFPETALPPLRERALALITLLHRLSDWSPAHQLAFLHLSLPLLDAIPTSTPEQHTKASETPSSSSEQAPSSPAPPSSSPSIDTATSLTSLKFRGETDKKELLSFLLDFLLLTSDSLASATGTTPPPIQSTSSPVSVSFLNPTGTGAVSTQPQAPKSVVPGPPFGLSVNALKRVIPKNKDLCNGAALAQLKIKALGFLFDGTGGGGETKEEEKAKWIFTDEEVFPHFVVGSCDHHHAVLRRAEDGLKRLRPDFENHQMISSLYSIYLGSTSAAVGGGKDIPVDDKRSQASLPLRILIVSQLVKSNKAVNAFSPLALQVIFGCVFGNDSNLRAKQTGMSFIQAVCQRSQEDQIIKIGPVLLQGILKLLLQESANISSQQNIEQQQLRTYAYNALAKIAKRVPSLFSGSTNVVELLLAIMAKEDNNSRIAIQEALSSLCGAYESATLDIRAQLEKILSLSILRSESQARLVAVSYANRLFPFGHPRARLICLLGLGDQRIDVRDESKRGLKPYRLRKSEPVPEPSEPFPEFKSMVKVIYEHYQTVKDRKSSETNSPILPFQNVYGELLAFLRKCLHYTASQLYPNPDSRYAPSLFLESLLSDSGEGSTTSNNYRELIERALGDGADGDLLADAALSLFELVTLAPTAFAKQYAPRISWLKQLLYTTRLETSDTIARLLGVIVTELPKEEIVALVKEFNETLLTPPKAVARGAGSPIHGSVSALGFILARYLRTRTEEETSDSTLVQSIDETTLRTSFENLCGLLEKDDVALVGVACQAVGAAAMYTPLPFPDEGDSSTPTSSSITPSSSLTKRVVVARLTKLTKATDRKVSEKAVIALGNLCLGEKSPPFLEEVLAALFAMANVRNEELHFSVGEALANIGAGWTSTAVQDLLAPPPPPSLDNSVATTPLQFAVKSKKLLEKDSKDMKLVLKKLTNFIFASQALARSSAVIWLLNVVKFAGSHPSIQEALPEIQVIFTNLLGDTNDLVQEVASRGLVEVYEHGGKEVKESLVSSLVSTISTGVSMTTGFKKTEDSELFPKDALGSGPSGESLSTYKELCSIATELGQPELMYKFMNLASHHALWNSKKGAAFAVRNLAFSASAQLEPFLPHLFPKVYRSSYDPNPRLAQSMNAILKSITTDPNKAIEKYFDEVMKELIESFRSKQWRVREAACSAIVDVLSGKDFSQVGKYLEELWEIAFREMDDVKETVRKAARGAVNAISSLSLRLCDPAHTNETDSNKAFPLILPQVLKGVNSNVSDVRSYAINFILKICKIAGNRLQKHIPEIVDVLLESLTSLEPAQMNYLSFHAEKYDITQEQLESARLSMSRMTPMNEALEYCAKSVNEENIKELTEKLAHLIKQGVGLPTKAGTAKFVINLAKTHPQLMKSNSARLLRTLTLCLEDRSPSIRKAYAAAAANLAKLASEKQVKALVDHLVFLYQKSEENIEGRTVVAVAFLELAHTAPAKLQIFNKEALPLVFLGTSDPNEEVQKAFKTVWEEVGAGGTVRIYLKEMVALATTCLSSASWTLKQQGAMTLGRIAEATNTYFQPFFHPVLKQLMENLSGSLWKGKESIFEALSAVCAAGAAELTAPDSTSNGSLSSSGKSGQSIVETLFSSVLKETKKTNREYRLKAVKCVDSLMETFSSLLTSRTFVETREHIGPLATSSDEAVVKREEGEKESAEALREAMKKREAEGLVKSAACLALTSAFPAKNWSPELPQLARDLGTLLNTILSNCVWGVRVSALSAWVKLLQREISLCSVPEGDGRLSELLAPELIQELSRIITDGFKETKYSAVRKAAGELLKELVLALQQQPEGLFKSVLEEIEKKVIPEGLTAAQQTVDGSLTNSLNETKRLLQKTTPPSSSSSPSGTEQEPPSKRVKAADD